VDDTSTNDTADVNVRLKSRYMLVLVLALVLYNAAWIYVSYIRYTSLNYSVWDLGVNYERSWQVLHGSLTSLPDFVSFFTTDFIVVLLSPLSMLDQLSSLLAAQLAAMDISCILLYGIAMYMLHDRWKAIAISSAFLFYPPLAGITWFDFHYQVFFIPFFLAGYLLYLRGHYISSGILMVLSGTVRFPYVIFPLLFSLIIILNELRPGHGLVTRNRLWYAAILFLSTFALLIAGYVESKGMTYIHFLASSFGGPTSFQHTPETVALTIFFMFIFVLFIPLVSRKWLLFLIPFIALIIISSNTYFLYPQFFHRQYGGLYIPFIFLGLIDSVVVLRDYLKVHGHNGRKIIKKIRWVSKHSVTAIFVVMLVSIPFFQPYGPLNFASPNNFYLGREISSSNLTQLNGLNTVISLIPANATEILVQNNLPEYFPRALYNNTILAPPIVNFVNFSLYSIEMNMFNVTGLGAIMAHYPLEYVLLDYASSQFTAGNPSLHNISELMVSSGYYGVYAQNGIIVLLERNYTGQPVMMIGTPYFK